MNRCDGSRVVITGMGAVTALGDVAETWQGLVAGRSGVRRITHFDPSGFPVRIAAEVDIDVHAGPWSFPPQAQPEDMLSPSCRLGLAAAQQAFSDSGLDQWRCHPRRLGASLAVGSGASDNAEILPPALAATEADGFDLARALEAVKSCERPHYALRTYVGYGEGLIAQCFGVGGPLLNALTACAASAQAIGQAVHAIRRGDADVFLAGGAETLIHPIGLLSLSLLKSLCTDSNDDPTRASRPFDVTRSGFVLGEGAGMVVVESLHHARSRGARILAEISGYGCSADAYRLTDPRPDGRGAAQAMREALRDAQVEPQAIDYINAHGTSTPANDLAEAEAIRQVFGSHTPQVPVGSFKSLLGHATVGAGAIELIGTVCALREGLLPANTNTRNPDPRIRLDLILETPREGSFRHAITNSFGFGGQNACLVVSRYPQ